MGESTIIGVHVTGGLLRCAELVRRGPNLEVIRLEASPLVSSAGENGPKFSPNGSRFVASLPPTDVLSRCWPLPTAPGGKMRQLVANRLEADLPVALEKMTWGYRQSLAPGTGPASMAVVLAQAARSERIQQYLAGLSTLGLPVSLLTTEAEALTGLYRHGLETAPEDKDLLILARPDEWLVCAFIHGLAQAVRRVRFTPGQMEAAGRECRQLIAAQFPSASLKRILWCAAGASADDAVQLEQICEVPVVPLALKSNLIRPNGGPWADQDVVEFGPAIGLALAEIFDADSVIRFAEVQLTQEAAPTRWIDRMLARPRTCAITAGALLVAALGVHVGALAWETHRMNAFTRSATATLTLRKLQPQIVAKNRIDLYRLDVEAICGDIGAAIKDPITLNSIQLSRDHRLTIKGTAKDNPTAIFTFADDLRKSPRFKAVNPERASPGQGGDFTITAELTHVEKFSTPGLRGGL